MLVLGSYSNSSMKLACYSSFIYFGMGVFFLVILRCIGVFNFSTTGNVGFPNAVIFGGLFVICVAMCAFSTLEVSVLFTIVGELLLLFTLGGELACSNTVSNYVFNTWSCFFIHLYLFKCGL